MSELMMPSRPVLPAHRLREIAVAAQADPRTVRRVWLRLPTRGIIRERIEQALANAGFEAPTPEKARVRSRGVVGDEGKAARAA
jgi:hypothetical protein